MVGKHPPDGDDGDLTRRQRAILDFIRESSQRSGYPPSIREIGRAVGLASTAAVDYQLTALQEKGYLTRDPGRARSVTLKPSGPRRIEMASGATDDAGAADDAEAARRRPGMVSVPLFDRIAAGAPVVADREQVGILELPRQQVGSGELIAVEVAGDSMVEAGIFHGDVAVVRLQDDADDGDIVAARIADEATVKVLHRADGHTWLLPRSPGYEPIPGDECRVMGKVVTVIHRI
jgi:repressor LexA